MASPCQGLQRRIGVAVWLPSGGPGSGRATQDGVGANSYDHSETVKEYYELCNEFMVFGWNESLHFAPLAPHERVEDSIIRHQRLMLANLELQEGMTVVDIGCGIGGPMRRIVHESGVRVVGVNNNEVQVEKAKKLDAEAASTTWLSMLRAALWT